MWSPKLWVWNTWTRCKTALFMSFWLSTCTPSSPNKAEVPRRIFVRIFHPVCLTTDKTQLFSEFSLSNQTGKVFFPTFLTFSRFFLLKLNWQKDWENLFQKIKVTNVPFFGLKSNCQNCEFRTSLSLTFTIKSFERKHSIKSFWKTLQQWIFFSIIIVKTTQ